MPSDEMWARIAIAVDRPCPYPKGSRKRVQWYRFRQLAGVAIFHAGDSVNAVCRELAHKYRARDATVSNLPEARLLTIGDGRVACPHGVLRKMKDRGADGCVS